MSDPTSSTHLRVRIAAWAVVLVALLPITMGAFVTTLKAGMAFADWPSSDGHFMLTYPWFRDLANPDKFTEHGHRLAGVLIGLCSIALVWVTFRNDQRSAVRRFSVIILLSVIAQGLLGGARVLLDRQTLAMLHSVTGSVFFCLCVMFLVVTGKRWRQLSLEEDHRLSVVMFAIIAVLPVLVFGQYLLGSSFRHLHTMLHEHIAGAVLVTLLAGGAVCGLFRSDSISLRRQGGLLASALLFQLALGLGSFVTRLGFPTWGVVATPGSWAQTVTCSMHTVGGMVLLACSVVSAASVLRLYSLDRLRGATLTSEIPLSSRADGGMA